MLYRTEGIVLRTLPFGEADLIITYISHDYGLLKLFAKSPRKIKSRFGSSLEPLTRSKISFWGKEDAALPRLIQSDIIHPFQLIRENLNSFLKVSEIIELTINFIPERETNKRAYFLLLYTLHNIENDFNGDLITTHYKIKILHLMGYAPKLDACGRCGKNGNSFYVSQGSIICEACAEGIDFPIRLSPAILKLYNDLLLWDILKIKRIRPSYMLLSGVSDIINLHIKYILDKPLKPETLICQLPQNF